MPKLPHGSGSAALPLANAVVWFLAVVRSCSASRWSRNHGQTRLLKLARGRPLFLGVRQRCGTHGSDYLHQCQPDANSSVTRLLVRRDVGGVWQFGYSP